MKTAVLKVLAFSLTVSAAISCSKQQSTPANTEKSKTVLLTQASWKIQAVGLDEDKNGVADPGMDYTTSIQPCQMDNTYSFKTDGTGAMDEGATKCSDSNPQTSPFTWTFKTSETILNGTFTFLSGSTSNGDATLISLTDSNLVVRYYTNLGGGPGFYNVLVTFKH